MEFIETPGRMLGIFFLIASAVLFIYSEKKKTKERRARRAARLESERLATEALEQESNNTTAPKAEISYAEELHNLQNPAITKK
jgi:hypothetical protein